MKLSITSFLDTMLDRFLPEFAFNLDSQGSVDGLPWPKDAKYLARYSLGGPIRRNKRFRFFQNAEQLSSWYRRGYSDNAQTPHCDNFFVLDALYMWDLGPLLLEDRAPHLRRTCAAF